MGRRVGWKEMLFKCPHCKQQYKSYPVGEAKPIYCDCGAYLQVVSQYTRFSTVEDVGAHFGLIDTGVYGQSVYFLRGEELDEEVFEEKYGDEFTFLKSQLSIKSFLLGEDDEGELFYVEVYKEKAKRGRKVAPAVNTSPPQTDVAADNLDRSPQGSFVPADPMKTYSVNMGGDTYDLLAGVNLGSKIYVFPFSADTEEALIAGQTIPLEYLPEYAETTWGIRWPGWEVKTINGRDVNLLVESKAYAGLTYEEINPPHGIPSEFNMKCLKEKPKPVIHSGTFCTRFGGLYNSDNVEFDFTSYDKSSGFLFGDQAVEVSYHCPNCKGDLTLSKIITGGSVTCPNCKKPHTTHVSPIG